MARTGDAATSMVSSGCETLMADGLLRWVEPAASATGSSSSVLTLDECFLASYSMTAA